MQGAEESLMEPATLEAHTADARGRQTLLCKRFVWGSNGGVAKSGTCLREEPSCH